MSAILAAARADFRQRVRSYRFLVVLMLTLLACAYMLPVQGAGYTVMQLGEARGIFGSAWIGLVFGAIGTLILPLLGFYLVRDSLQRDRDTRVGVLLAATPLSRLGYVAAKFLSNAAVLGAVLGIALLVAPLLQWWRGEDPGVNPLVIAAHALLIAAPALLGVAALAVLFECVPLLRGAVGNVAYFFLWGLLTTLAIARPGQLEKDARGPIVERRYDLFGMTAPLADFEAGLARAVPDYPRSIAIGVQIGRDVKHRIAWPGMLGDTAWVLSRLAWALVCLPLLLLAAQLFDRFDPARDRRRGSPPPAEPESTGLVGVPATTTPWQALTPLPESSAGWRPLALVTAELRLLLKRQRWWWYVGVLGFWIAGSAAPLDHAVRYVIPLAWFWALSRWSEHGARAEMHDTMRLLASAPAPVLRQLPAQWLAATLMGLLLALPVLVRLAAGSAYGGIAQAAAGAGLVAALALASGALSRGPRLFELLFLGLWYAGMQRVPGTAIGGEHGLGFAASSAPGYLLLAAGLLALAGVLRGRRG